MDNTQNNLKLKFGLIGKNIDYSFSRTYFANKFKMLGLPHSYVNFDIQTITAFKTIIDTTNQLSGLNVTIPYKEAIIPYLDTLDTHAKTIGAVNTIKFTKDNKRIGYNTDFYGFKTALEPYLKPWHNTALILGTGGASKAVAYALKQLGISYAYVSRRKSETVAFTYNDLSKDIIAKHKLIINCTPLGTFPNSNDYPNIPYEGITQSHIAFDLIYNPLQTTFMKKCSKHHAISVNGLRMLELQAENAWAIWNS